MRLIFPLITLLSLTPCWSSTQSSWTADAKVNLKAVRSAKELSAVIAKLTDEWCLSGQNDEGSEFNCHYRSFISSVSVAEQTFNVVVTFDFKKDSEACGNGEDGIQDMWKDISEVPHLTIGELQPI